MEAELIVDKHYQKGFNQGYVFAEHEPQFAKMLTQKNVPENEYFTGFKAGREQFGLEKMRDRLKDLPDTGKGHDKSKGMDKSK